MLLRPYVSLRKALEPTVFAATRERVLSSPLIARSTLAGSFQASRGFAVTFTLPGLPRVEERFEAFAPFLRLALLQPWWRRRRPNAFYLNVLVVPSGAGVGRHTDGTLRGPSGEAQALPREVTVLYLQVPPGSSGGRLRLFRDDQVVAELSPEENTLVRFPGSLAHEVERLEAAPGEFRASLVLEQYLLPDSALARLEPMRLQSNAGFSAYLDDARPPRDFIVD